MADKNIEVKIANRTYPLQVSEQEERKIRVAVQLINDNINKLKGDYVVTDYVDLLAMTALELAMGADSVELNKDKLLNNELEGELDQMTERIENILTSGASS